MLVPPLYKILKKSTQNLFPHYRKMSNPNPSKTRNTSSETPQTHHRRSYYKPTLTPLTHNSQSLKNWTPNGPKIITEEIYRLMNTKINCLVPHFAEKKWTTTFQNPAKFPRFYFFFIFDAISRPNCVLDVRFMLWIPKAKSSNIPINTSLKVTLHKIP